MTSDLTSGNRGSPIWLQGPAGSHYSLVPQGDWDPAYSRGYSNKQAGNQPHLSPVLNGRHEKPITTNTGQTIFIIFPDYTHCYYALPQLNLQAQPLVVYWVYSHKPGLCSLTFNFADWWVIVLCLPALHIKKENIWMMETNNRTMSSWWLE